MGRGGDNKICPVLSPPQAVPSDYLGGVLGGAPGKLCWQGAPHRAHNSLCGHSSPPPSGRGILAASNKSIFGLKQLLGCYILPFLFLRTVILVEDSLLQNIGTEVYGAEISDYSC